MLRVSFVFSKKKIHWITFNEFSPSWKFIECNSFGPYWKLQPVTCTVNMELRSEFGLWTGTILTPGSEFLMDQIGLWWIWTTMGQKFQKLSPKNMRWNWMRKILLADQRPKQNHKEENLPAFPQEQFLLERELGLMLNQGNILSPIMKYRRKWCICFVIHNMCIEKKMEQFNSGELKKIFRNISHTLLIGLKASGKHAWQEEEEEIREDSSTVLILQEQLCISELFRDIQDAILLILRYRTMP